MDGTILGQGTFVASALGLVNPNSGFASTSQANPAIIAIPSGADWVSVRNFTESGLTSAAGGAYFNGVANADVGVEFYWQRGMPTGSAFVKYYSAAQAISGDTILAGGFTLYDPSGQDQAALPLIGAAVPVTVATNVTRPVITHTADPSVVVGSVVRMSNTAQTDVNGIDMVVGTVTSGTQFTLLTATNPLANAPGIAGGAGFYRVINVDSLFYPRSRYVVNITQAANAQVSTSVAHGFTVGQQVRFRIPDVSGMVQLNGITQNNYQPATVLSVVDDYNFTININTSGFTAFSWPTAAQQASSFPQVNPVGEDTATSLASPVAQVPSVGGVQIYNTNTQILADSTVNTGFLGMILGSGGVGSVAAFPIIGPSGAINWDASDVPTGDVMFWLAGKSTYGGL